MASVEGAVSRRLLPLGTGLFSMNLAWVSWAIFGYLDTASLALVWSLFSLGIALIVLSASESYGSRLTTWLSYLSLALAIAAALSIVGYFHPVRITDEVIIDRYAAIALLHREDPYRPGVIGSYLQSSSYPTFWFTPTLDGGFVTAFIYPGLVPLYFLLEVALHLNPLVLYEVPVAVSFTAYYLYMRKNGIALEERYDLMLFSIALFAELAGFAFYFSSATIWIMFVILSLSSSERPSISGIFSGLAASFNQIPALLVPFLAVFHFRENGRKGLIRYLALSIVSFSVINGPFLAMSPGSFIHAMEHSLSQGAIGVGFGVSELSFLALASIAPRVFTIALFASYSMLLTAYALWYERLRLSFVVFPAIVMFLNYRVLPEYVLVWSVPAAMLALGRKPLRAHRVAGTLRKKALAASIAVLILVVAVPLGLHSQEAYEKSQDLKVISIRSYSDPYNVTGYITEMDVSVLYTGTQDTYVGFRIIPYGETMNANGLIWTPDPMKGAADTRGALLRPGYNNVTIFPQSYVDLLPDGRPFRLFVTDNTSISFLNSGGLSVSGVTPVSDPELAYPTYNSKDPYPGWLAHSNGTWVFHYHPGYLEAVSEGPGNLDLQTRVNGTEASWTLSFIISVNSTAPVSVELIDSQGSYVNASQGQVEDSSMQLSVEVTPGLGGNVSLRVSAVSGCSLDIRPAAYGG
ncbi:hypothetical protein GCM10007108_16840 [Thermogymnomonas acidicola]|uniref:Uncharacterized protein n=1 Tax=Thermogymnomonas acidicola TaxID=399579 RepID=A0AA37BSQ3_9ARCH|nr:hypothetical protein [Thermogymnomonas acidicola]GGM79230.1 hypothetical protein GCM10007108_16840 [Thermogymnomonas acidicola]